LIRASVFALKHERELFSISHPSLEERWNFFSVQLFPPCCFQRLAQEGKIDYNKIKKGEYKQPTEKHTEKFTDGNFP